MQITHKGLANRVAQAKLHGTTQTEIATMAGINQSRMSRALNGKLTLSLKEIARLCLTFEVGFSDLVEVSADD